MNKATIDLIYATVYKDIISAHLFFPQQLFVCSFIFS